MDEPAVETNKLRRRIMVTLIGVNNERLSCHEVEILEQFVQASSSSVFSALLDDNPVVLKKFDQPTSQLREYTHHRCAMASGARVPRLIGRTIVDGKPCIISEWIRGNLEWPLCSSSPAELAMLLADLHLRGGTLSTAEFESAGLKAVTPNEWQSRLSVKINGYLEALDCSAELEGSVVSKLKYFLDRGIKAASAKFSSLVHCDYSGRNVIRGRDGLFIIDFGAAVVGDPRFDLGKIVWNQYEGRHCADSRQFVNTWSRTTCLEVGEEVLRVYVAAHALAALFWLNRTGGDSDDQFRVRAVDALTEAVS